MPVIVFQVGLPDEKGDSGEVRKEEKSDISMYYICVSNVYLFRNVYTSVQLGKRFICTKTVLCNIKTKLLQLYLFLICLQTLMIVRIQF